MLELLAMPPVDPILSLSAAVRSDPRLDKIDLGVGVYRDDYGRTPIMAAVREAEKKLLNSRERKTYVGAWGDLQFVAHIARSFSGDRRLNGWEGSRQPVGRAPCAFSRV